MAKRKDAPSSVLTRSGRERSTGIQASTSPLNTRKSPRFEKQMGPTPSTVKKKPEKNEKQMGPSPSTVKKKPEKSEKQKGSTPLRRSERVKNPVDVPASNAKSTEKSADISEESAVHKEDGSRDSNGGSKKRKRSHAAEFKARYKPQRVRVETEVSEVLTHIESPSSSGDQFWSAAVGNGTPVTNETADGNADSLYQHLKPTVSELCNILTFSEGAKIIVERFLKFVVGNFNVSKEHTSILQALMISVCWICSSLSKHTIDREESFALAKKHLNFSCKEEEADQVYEKLKKPKEMFLQSPQNLQVLNAFKDRASRPEEPRMSPAVPLNLQEQKRENHGSSNEEALQSNGQIIEENIARKEKNEIDKFDRLWDEKKMNIENDFVLEKALIRHLYRSNSSVTSEKLNLVEKKFADKLNEHERLRQVNFDDLKAMLKAGVGQVAVTDNLSLNGPVHKTQIMDLVESEKEDQESREVPPALSGNPSEAQILDKPLHEMCPVVVPTEVIIISDDSSDGESIGSHSSEKQTADAMVKTEPIMENDVTVDNATLLSEPIGDISAIEEIVSSIPIEENASELHDEVENDVVGADATVLSEPIGDIPAKQGADMENDVAGADATVSSEPIGNIPDIEEIASEQHDEVENVVSGDDALVLTEPIGDISAKQHADMEIDVSGQDESLEMEVPEVDFNKENAKGEGTSNPDGSHAVEAGIETGQNDLTPHVNLAEMEIPAINNLRPHVDSADGSHAVENAIGTGSNYVAPHAKSPELEMPAGNDMASNVDSTDESRPSVDPNVTGPNDIASHVNTGEMEILADNDSAPHVGSSADGSNAVEDGNETAPNDMAPRFDPCEMNMPAVNDVDSADGSHAVQDPPNETGLYDMSPHVDSDKTGMPADIDMAPNDYSDDMSHAAEDPNKNGSNDIPLHADSDQMGIPAANDLTPHIESADGSHADEDPNGTCPNHVAPNVGSAESGIPAGNCSQENVQDTTPAVQQVASPVSDHSMPAIPEIHSDFQLIQQSSENGIQDQGQANSNQVGSRMTPRVDPLHIELKHLSSVKEKIVKSYEDNIQKINIDCEKEITEAIAKIRLKYCNKRQEADATFNSQKKEVENNMNTVFINQVLAAVCRRKGQDVTSGRAALQQACQAESMQQLHRSSGPSSLPGQSSGSQQTPPPPPPPISATTTETPPQQTQPPLQIVHQPSALFSTPLTRHPHTTNLRPANTTPIRPPPNTNPITLSTPTTTNRPLMTITPITPSTTPSTIISPHGMNPLTPSTTPIRPLFNSNPFRTFAATPRINTETCGQSPQGRPLVSSVTHSTAPHMRPMVSREIRTPGPHMRPFASSDVRTSTSHMRPSNSISSSGPPGSGTYHRILPVQHVTSSFLLTSPSNSQPLNSTSSVQPRSESSQPPPPSKLPHASAATSSHSSLPHSSSVPQSGGPQDKLIDNVNVLTDNAARGLNILKTPEFPGGGTAAQPPPAHEVVYLSDDD